MEPYVDPDPDAAGRFGAALLFLRWDAAAVRPEGHLETEFLVLAPDPEAARTAVLALTLHEVKAHLERLIGARGAGSPGP